MTLKVTSKLIAATTLLSLTACGSPLLALNTPMPVATSTLLPTSTPVPTSTPLPTSTPVPTPTLLPPKPWGEIDPQTALIDGKALTFGGDYNATDWRNCGAAKRYVASDPLIDPKALIRYSSVTWQTGQCDAGSAKNVPYAAQEIYVMTSDRQAKRVAEAYRSAIGFATTYSPLLGAKASNGKTVFAGVDIEYSQVSFAGHEISTIIIQVDQVMTFIHLIGKRRLLEDDLAEVVSTALNKLDAARKQPTVSGVS